jgi:hypothetical protein
MLVDKLKNKNSRVNNTTIKIPVNIVNKETT